MSERYQVECRSGSPRDVGTTWLRDTGSSLSSSIIASLHKLMKKYLTGHTQLRRGECVSEQYQGVEWFSSRCRNYVASPQRDELVEMSDDGRLRGAIQVPQRHTQSSSMNGR